MAYALNISDIQHVKEQIHEELVAKAYLLDDAMFGNLGIMVTTDVENIDVCQIFNRKGLVARPYRIGNVKGSQLAKIVDNPAKVEEYYIKAKDSINRYREKGPYNVNNAADEAVMSRKNMEEIAGRAAEDVRFNIFFGNKNNRSLPDTAANQVKLGLSLFDGFYTLIAQKRTDGTISVQNRNLIETGGLTKVVGGQTVALTPVEVYELLVKFYGALHPFMKKPENKLTILASDEFCRLAVKGYMLTFPQISPTVLEASWKFAEMPNLTLKTSAAMGTGGQLIAVCRDDILEFICDTREGKANIRIGQTDEDLSIIGYQINSAATTRIRDYDPMYFAVNDAVNTYDWTPGQYIADIFTVQSSDTNEGTVAITSGQKDLYADGDIITVTATPANGFKFVGWSDGQKTFTENPLNYEFGGGVKNLVAQFETA